MSEVISFRLDKDNPREAQAFEILEAWCSKGYSLRYIITEALLKLNDPGPESISGEQFPELNVVFNQVNKLLEHIENGGYPLISKQDENTPQSALANSFVLSIRKAAKPGLKTN